MERRGMRNYLIIATGVTVVVLLILLAGQGLVEGQERRPSIRVHFSPDGGAMKAVSDEIRGAKKSLDVALYMLTVPRLAWDLVSAKKRGVRVRVIFDKRMSFKWSEARTLEENGVPTWRLFLPKDKKDPSNPQFHHKFAVIDGSTVVTGSFNWTVMADKRNHEDLLVIRDPALAKLYTAAFEKALKLAVEQEKK